MQRSAPEPVLRRIRAPREPRGFTLVELMVTLIVVAILAAVALPAYTGQIRKSRRAEAITELNKVLQAQERYRADHAAFSDRFLLVDGQLARIAGSGESAAVGSYDGAAGYYRLSIPAATASGYTVLATALGSQLDDASCKFLQIQMSGGNLTYNSGATSGTSNGASSDATRRCWNR